MQQLDSGSYASADALPFAKEVGSSRGIGLKTLELEDVQGFALAESRHDDPLSLRLSGLAFHSALAVERVETTTRGDALVVKVLLARAREGKSGSFDFVVHVPPGVHRVLFGDEGRQIWPRRE